MKISRCKRNILLIFGYLLIMAILFIPYEKEFIKLSKLDNQFKNPSFIFLSKTGYIFLPMYLINKTKYKEISDAHMEKLKQEKIFSIPSIFWVVKYVVNIDLFVTEIAFIVAVIGFAYILFCVVLRKEGKGER